MTRYQTITSLGDNLLKLVNKRLIPIHILDWKVYYEAYLAEKESSAKSRIKTNKTQIIYNLAGHFDITERTLYNVIAFMESE